MKNTLFTGSGVAIVAPMHSDGSINYDMLEQLINRQIENSTDAIIICGTTGEASTLTDDEHIECIRCAVKATNGRVPVVAGTGSNDTAYSVELSKEAKNLGADALLQVTPYYNKTSQRGLVAHFTKIADEVDLPMILYNVPSRTGMNIAIDTYIQLAQHKNITAVKEASGDLSRVAQIAAACDLDIYSGNDDQITSIISLGGKGVISVLANCMPKETHDIAALYLDGKTRESLDLQLKLLKFTNNLFMDVNPVPVKHALNLMGLNVGSCRLPLVDMTDTQISALKESMAEIGLI